MITETEKKRSNGEPKFYEAFLRVIWSMLVPLPLKEIVKSLRFTAFLQTASFLLFPTQVINLDAIYLSSHEFHLLLIGVSSLITVNVFVT